ncbi:MAG: hypothetical protein ACLQU2_05450, partial [Candidatus Binataceae bacterium]
MVLAGFRSWFDLLGPEQLITQGRCHYWGRRRYFYLDKSQAYFFMTAVALRCEFFEGSIEFDGILGLDRVG